MADNENQDNQENQEQEEQYGYDLLDPDIHWMAVTLDKISRAVGVDITELAIQKAAEAAASAEAAGTSATGAAGSASDAAESAAQAGGSASNAAASAEQAEESADDAADSADLAARHAAAASAKIDNMTVAAQTLAPGSSASATVSEVDGHKHILFGIAKGDPGNDFRISKTFVSIAAMEAYTGTDVLVNDCVMIDTGSVEDVDTGKLYRRTENGWSYIGDLSGKQGIKGDAGNGIASTVLNPDFTLTITFTDGTSYTTPSIRGMTGLTPNLTIGTVQTLSPGSSATVTITGTPENPVLNLGIPKGETGGLSNAYATVIPMSPQDETLISDAIGAKVDKSQGAANAGKVLGVGPDGNVLPVPLADFTGATASTAGEHGYVPAPAAGDQGKYLKGDGTWGNVVDLIYPVGSIYMSVASASPATLFGGTWEQLEDRFLLGAGQTYTAGDTGGSASHTLTIDEMPSHNHTFTGSEVTSSDISANHKHTGTSGKPSDNHHHSGPSHVHKIGVSEDGSVVNNNIQWAANPGGNTKSFRQNSPYGFACSNPGSYSSGTGATGNVSAWHTHTTTTGYQSSGHTHSVTAEGSIGNTGSGTAFSVMNPYLVVYMWKRTA